MSAVSVCETLAVERWLRWNMIVLVDISHVADSTALQAL